jgi:hypothetical protein
MGKIECIPLDNPLEWNKSLEGIKHSFAHTWEYNYAMHLTTGFPTYLFKFEQSNIRIVCPIAERKFLSYTDIITPFGISGFVGNRPCEGFPSIWSQFAQDKGYISGYIVVNPYLAHESYIDQDSIYMYNHLFCLDLRLSEKEIISNFSRNRKRQIRDFDKSEENFYTEKPILIDFFVSNFYDFYKRKNASASYHLSKETLLFLLNQDNIILVGIMKRGLIVAVSLFVYTMYIGDHFFNISLEGAEKYIVPLTWFGLKKLKSNNIPYLNLGGGSGKENDSYAEFKRRFGPDVYPLRAIKQIYDYQIYRELCLKCGADPENKSGYFPPFHAF